MSGGPGPHTAYLIAHVGADGQLRRVAIYSEWPLTMAFRPNEALPMLITSTSSQTSYARAQAKLVAQVNDYPHMRWLMPWLKRSL